MIQTPFETIGQTTFGSTAQVQAALDKFLRAHLQCRSCSPADSQDDQVGEDDEDNEYGDEYEGQVSRRNRRLHVQRFSDPSPGTPTLEA